MNVSDEDFVRLMLGDTTVLPAQPSRALTKQAILDAIAEADRLLPRKRSPLYPQIYWPLVVQK